MVASHSPNRYGFVVACCMMVAMGVGSIFVHGAEIQEVWRLFGSLSLTVAPVQSIQIIQAPQPTLTPTLTSTYTQYVTNTTWDILCESNAHLCQKIVFEDFSATDTTYKYIYGRIVIETINQLDYHLVTSKRIQDVIRSITISHGTDTRRAYATATRIWINIGYISTEQEFRNVLMHELGHIIDLSVVGGTDKRVDRQFTEFGVAKFSLDDPSLVYYGLSWESENTQKPLAQPQDFCSGYGMTNPFEDFAECFNLFIYHNGYFSYIAQTNPILAQKYRYIHDIVGGYYKDNNMSLVKQIHSAGRTDWRSWDTTRIHWENSRISSL